jgi:hypothetical protein
MESQNTKSFLIKLGALHLKVVPQLNDERLSYFVTLPSKIIELYQQEDGNNVPYWYQHGIGRTALSEQIGYLIESHLLNPE